MAKKAIIRAKLEGVLTELLFKTGVDNVVYETVDGSEVMLSTKLAEIIADLATKDTITGREAAITALKQELLGDTPVEAYNTFTELAAYIEEHQEVADALNAAIGNKADKATTLAGYGITDAMTRAETTAAIAEAVSDATGGESAASVKTALEAYQTSNDAAVAELESDVAALEQDTHTHANKSTLDGITDAKVAAWDAAEANAKAYADTLGTVTIDGAAYDLEIEILE